MLVFCILFCWTAPAHKSKVRFTLCLPHRSKIRLLNEGEGDRLVLGLKALIWTLGYRQIRILEKRGKQKSKSGQKPRLEKSELSCRNQIFK